MKKINNSRKITFTAHTLSNFTWQNLLKYIHIARIFLILKMYIIIHSFLSCHRTLIIFLSYLRRLLQILRTWKLQYFNITSCTVEHFLINYLFFLMYRLGESRVGAYVIAGRSLNRLFELDFQSGWSAQQSEPANVNLTPRFREIRFCESCIWVNC